MSLPEYVLSIFPSDHTRPLTRHSRVDGAPNFRRVPLTFSLDESGQGLPDLDGKKVCGRSEGISFLQHYLTWWSAACLPWTACVMHWNEWMQARVLLIWLIGRAYEKSR
jgi:hypothetical protein